MLHQRKFLKSLIQQFEYLSESFLPVVSIEPLSKSPGSLKFQASYYQPHVKEQTAHLSTHHFVFDGTKQSSIEKISTFPLIESGIRANSLSSDGQYKAIIRKTGEATVLEIWGTNHLLQSLKISDFHNDLYTDAQFTAKALIWSKDKKRLLYIAEKKEEKTPNYFGNSENPSEGDYDKYIRKFRYQPDLGEGYQKKSSPIICIYDVKANQLSRVSNIDKDIIPTYVSFADEEGSKIVFCGYHLEKSQQGLKFAFNRDSKIYFLEHLALESLHPDPNKAKSSQGSSDGNNSLRKLSEEFISVFPTPDQSLKKVLYFFSGHTNLHATGLGIKLIDLEAGEQRVILDIVKENNPKFSGVMAYHDMLGKTSWLSDSKHVVFNTEIQGAVGIYVLNVESREMKRIDAPTYRSEEWRIKNVHQDLIFASISNLDGHSRFAIFDGFDKSARSLDKALEKGKWHYFDLDKTEKETSADDASLANIGEIEEKVIEIDGVQSLYFSLKEFRNEKGELVPQSKRPIMVALHGGPHGAATGMFSTQKYYSLYKGYNLLYPNFSGSTGFGQDFLERLPGNIGELDALEVKAAIDYCVENNLGDPEKLIVMGGSYGGYLGAVMIAKFPDLFKCAILKNAVVNLPFTFETSDIPEWAYAEVLKKDMSHQPTSQELKEFYDVSPVCMNTDLKSSVLLMVGANDKRVPCGGSIQYYKMLKRKGVDVQLLTYPSDEHGLMGTADSEADQFIKTYWFIEDKLQRK